MIFFNGPKGCGKNTLIDFCKLHNWVDISCKIPLYALVQNLFNISYDTFWGIYKDRIAKETPDKAFRVCLSHLELQALTKIIGMESIDPDDSNRGFEFDMDTYKVTLNLSVREAMIYVSEVIVKPRWGEDYFGKARMEKPQHYGNCDWVFYDDSSASFNGDSVELDAAIEHFGQENCLLIRIYGRGSFDGDSRGYIPNGVVGNVMEITNDGDLKTFLDSSKERIYKWLGNVGVGA